MILCRRVCTAVFCCPGYPGYPGCPGCPGYPGCPGRADRCAGAAGDPAGGYPPAMLAGLFRLCYTLRAVSLYRAAERGCSHGFNTYFFDFGRGECGWLLHLQMVRPE